ncbi:hypothetical protein EON82_09475 [bacterium]|nr:MAG: hypothetical protein EON82_09475 [bacterium]
MLADRRAARWLNGLCATVGLAAIGSIAAIALMRKELSDGAIRPKESPIRQELREARRIAILGELSPLTESGAKLGTCTAA